VRGSKKRWGDIWHPRRRCTRPGNIWSRVG
jgi:hypothetical protein